MTTRSLALLALMLLVTAGSAASAAADFCPTCRFVKVARCGGFLEGPSIDAKGRLRVVDLASGHVLAVENGKCTRVASTGGRANGSRLDATGRLFVADAMRGLLRLKDDDSFSVEVAREPSDGGPNDLVFDASGGVYFTVPGSSSYQKRTGKVFYRPAAGGGARLFREGLAFPNGIAISPDGKYIWVGQFADKSIVALPAVDNTDAMKLDYVLVRTADGLGPDGMIVDSRRRLLWANFAGGSIGVATADGTVLGTVRLPADAGSLVTNIVEQRGGFYVTEAQKGEVWKLTGLD